jgi:uncharacterized protein YjiS (DUF1127 family)
MLTIPLWRGRLFPRTGGGFWGRCRRILVAVPDLALAWQERARQRHYLAMVDDHMLHDIGISRADAVRESAKPFWRH